MPNLQRAIISTVFSSDKRSGSGFTPFGHRRNLDQKPGFWNAVIGAIEHMAGVMGPVPRDLFSLKQYH